MAIRVDKKEAKSIEKAQKDAEMVSELAKDARNRREAKTISNELESEIKNIEDDQTNRNGVSLSAQQQEDAGDSDRRLADFAKKLDAAIKESNVNLTLPKNGSLSEFITKLNSSEPFQTLSQKFTQLAQESGINVTGERLKNLQGGERANLTGLAEKLQEVMGRVQPLRE